MKFTPNSGSRRRVRMTSALSAGGPQMPGPVSRIAPKPRRLILIAPPTMNEPDLPASRAIFDPLWGCVTLIALSALDAGHAMILIGYVHANPSYRTSASGAKLQL